MIELIVNKLNVIMLNLSSDNNKISFFANVKRNCRFEGHNKILHRTVFSNSSIGFASYISNNCQILNTRIGRFCSIGSNVRIVAGNHPTSKFVSTHPVFYNPHAVRGFSLVDNVKFEEYKYVSNQSQLWCSIGNDVWISSNVLILNGVTIGDGAVIASGSVVTKNVEPYTVNGGVPAKLIRERFSKEQVTFLKSLKWWEKDLDWIRKHAKYFDDIEDLVKELSN